METPQSRTVSLGNRPRWLTSFRRTCLLMCQDTTLSFRKSFISTMTPSGMTCCKQASLASCKGDAGTYEIRQRVKPCRHKPYGVTMERTRAPTRPTESISMDFITGLRLSKWDGKVYDAVLMIMDLYMSPYFVLPVVRRRSNAETLRDLRSEDECRGRHPSRGGTSGFGNTPPHGGSESPNKRIRNLCSSAKLDDY